VSFANAKVKNQFANKKRWLFYPHISPFQKPYPPIGIAGLSPSSETLKMAGQYGFIPLSLAYNDDLIASHWDSIVEGANRSGKTPEKIKVYVCEYRN
jgi:alkanesulfonate monooxygenase SsuD/methylene tetrahydromethanopterin reductase-like flavin-dependent oxidoreductase (luciferase family)